MINTNRKATSCKEVAKKKTRWRVSVLQFYNHHLLSAPV
nr:MAG TPA_asm: hypothetical protein [Bacteriophage sp.]